MDNRDVVSIIIPTYNNQDTIAICLESIKNQTYDNIEVIVVDGGSDDLTKDICSTYDVSLIESDLGMAASRNKGGDNANGEYIFHIDSDMELSSHLVEDCVSIAEESDAVIVPENNVGSSYWAKVTDIGKTLSRMKRDGNLRFIKRCLYYSVGKHNEKLLAKEDEELHSLVDSRGVDIGYSNEIIRHHVGDIRLRDILKTRWRYMESMSEYNKFSRVNQNKSQNTQTFSDISLLISLMKNKPRYIIGYIILEILTIALSLISKARQGR
jgi:glycosyltransferase involved in cell wall biosynthesis